MQVRQFLNLLVLLPLLFVGIAGCNQAHQPKKWRMYKEVVDIKERLQRKRLKVAVRETHSVDQGDSLLPWFLSGQNFYDESGFDTLALEFDAKGQILKKTRNIYKDSLLMVNIVQESSGYHSRTEFQYNEQGHKVSDLMFKRGDSLMRRDYTLDKNGNETTVHLFKFRDRSKFKLETKRNAKGEPVKVTEFQDGKANWSEVYDIQDTLWIIKRTRADGKLQSDYQMGFNADGQVTRMVNKDDEGKTRMKVTFSYGENGQVAEEKYWTPQGIVTQRSTFKYDENGLLSETAFHSKSVSFPIVTKHSYKFRN